MQAYLNSPAGRKGRKSNNGGQSPQQQQQQQGSSSGLPASLQKQVRMHSCVMSAAKHTCSCVWASRFIACRSASQAAGRKGAQCCRLAQARYSIGPSCCCADTNHDGEHVRPGRAGQEGVRSNIVRAAVVVWLQQQALADALARAPDQVVAAHACQRPVRKHYFRRYLV